MKHNREEICRTRLIHGFHFRKITVGLNEPLKPAPQGFATDYPVRTTMQRTVAYRNFALFRAIIYQASFSFYPFLPNDIEAPKALDVQLGGLHIEPSEANFVLAAILNGGKKDYHQY